MNRWMIGIFILVLMLFAGIFFIYSNIQLQNYEQSTNCPSNQYAYNESSAGSFTCSAALGKEFYTNTTVYSLTTTTGAFNQLGFELYFMPNSTAIFVNGVVVTQTNTVSCGTYTQLDYGTGIAPIRGVSQTGTLVGNPVTFFFPYAGLGYSQPIADLITGLTSGTRYWIDMAFTSAPGNGCGTATFASAQLVLIQI